MSTQYRLSNLLPNARFSGSIAAIMTTETNNFAVIKTGGKQYIVSPGDTIEVELLGEHNEGDTITFDEVLMKGDTVGTPTVSGAKVTGTYHGDKKGKKLTIMRFKSKSNFFRKVGHRQKYAQVTIDKI
jgi:large subunit ribosomal protein L21